MVADRDRSIVEFKRGRPSVVTSGANEHPLRQASVCTDAHFLKIQNPYTVAYPAGVTDLQLQGQCIFTLCRTNTSRPIVAPNKRRSAILMTCGHHHRLVMQPEVSSHNA